MAKRKYHFWLGGNGPFIFSSDKGELPFRMKEVPYFQPYLRGGLRSSRPINLAVNIPSAVAGTEPGSNIVGTVSGSDYTTFRAVHFNSFNIAGDLL